MLKRRTLRDLGTLAGVIVIIVGIALFKGVTERGDLAARATAWRTSMEQEREQMGLDIMSWSLLQRTRGNQRTGPTFAPELLEYRDSPINIIGFMVPLYEFRQAKEFLLLPMPLECYFCMMPPMRDVVFVQMAPGEEAQVVNEPVLINGTLELNEGEGTKFFYVIKDAKWGPGDESLRLTPQQVTPEHMGHALGAQEEEELLEGYEPPSFSPQGMPHGMPGMPQGLPPAAPEQPDSGS